MMDDQQLLRYSRHLMLPELEVAGQERLLAARVLVIGLGGLGCPAALYLAASGVGQLVLVDDDQVELTNLQRQVLHRTADIGRPKVESARESLLAVNPEVEVSVFAERLTDAALAEQVEAANLVLDCSDNFATRFAVNAACVRHRTPLVSGAAIRLEGQVAVYDSRNADSPCYRCLYQEGDEVALSCSESGVLAPLVGMIGTTQALEALKLLGGFGEPLVGRLLLLDAARLEWRSLRLRRDPGCPVCGGRARAS